MYSWCVYTKYKLGGMRHEYVRHKYRAQLILSRFAAAETRARGFSASVSLRWGSGDTPHANADPRPNEMVCFPPPAVLLTSPKRFGAPSPRLRCTQGRPSIRANQLESKVAKTANCRSAWPPANRVFKRINVGLRVARSPHLLPPPLPPTAQYDVPPIVY